MSEFAIRTTGLRKVYRSGFFMTKFIGLKGLDLEVHRGEVFGYIGPNGSGKTTTLKLLMGLNFPSSGSGEVLDAPLGDLRTRGRIGFLPERPYFYDYLTAFEFLDFYGRLHGIPGKVRRERIERLIPLVHMERARHVQLRKFSKGMLQRVGVAQALINEPDLVIFDEPMSGLDPMGRMLIRDIILDLKAKGTTVFFSSHVLSDVEQVSDRVALIANGEVHQQGTIEELLAGRTRRVEVTLDGLDRSLVEELPGHSPVFGSDDRVTLRTADSEEANALVRAALRRGARVISVVPRRETLEQMFVEEMSAVERVQREKGVR